MDIALHSRFSENQWVYFAYHKHAPGGEGATTLSGLNRIVPTSDARGSSENEEDESRKKVARQLTQRAGGLFRRHTCPNTTVVCEPNCVDAPLEWCEIFDKDPIESEWEAEKRECRGPTP